jgi:D,D-heptose 1,7-bisphosphate phosphatase
MRPALFLDRDGTINRINTKTDRVTHVSQFQLLPGVADALRAFQELGFLLIVVSNQAAIAKALMTPEDLDVIHDALRARLARRGVSLDRIAFCPHHERGVIEEYRIACACRKPQTGMVEQAIADLQIDRTYSFFIGDTTGDILTGNRAKIKTILLKTGHGGADGLYPEARPDYHARDLSDALRVIKSEFF